ncbi:hypothetical protein F5Y19DRAFT_104009 [Xylariaceae sp. FL1651]|nr:hypothetical protein F5Y19DRAFT_104009 [Xylariaceae sp. FL1651]
MSVSHSLPRVPCYWDKDFVSFRQDFYSPSENCTVVQYLQKGWTNPAESQCLGGDELEERGEKSVWSVSEARRSTEVDDGESSENLRAEQYDVGAVVRNFMRSTVAGINGPSFINQAEIVESFCADTNIRSLQNGNYKGHDQPVALVYDWENKPADLRQNSQKHGGQSSGTLTREQLLERLSRKRFRDGELCSKSENPQDADRRLLYISNLDPWVVLVLAQTASCLQTPVLQRTIFQHLTARTSFEVHISSRDFKTFSLELNLSYFTLRKCNPKEPTTDPRLNWDKSGPLRKTWKLPSDPTSPSLSKPSYNIYETQVSFVVSGIDHWRWVAWAFVDSWFEPDNTVSRYHEDEETGAQPDPLAAGQMDINPPERNPREYFLKVFEIRINEVAKEWDYILQILQEEVQRTGTDPLFASPELGFEDEEGRKKMRDLATWSGEMVKVLGGMLRSLSRMIVAWDAYQKTDIGYFLYDDDSCTCRPARLSSLRIIEKVFLNLRITHEELEQVKWSLEELGRGLARGERNYSILVQQRTGEHIKLLTWITIAWSPVLIATGICSTQTGIFPFRNDIWDFLGSFLVVSALVGLTIMIVLNRNAPFLRWKTFLSGCLYASRRETPAKEAAPQPLLQFPAPIPTRRRTHGTEVIRVVTSLEKDEVSGLASLKRDMLHPFRRLREGASSVRRSMLSDV